MVNFGTFGEALNYFLEKKKLSQKDFALKCNFIPGKINKHIRQGVKPDYEAVKKYVEVLDLELEDAKLLFTLAGYSQENILYQKDSCKEMFSTWIDELALKTAKETARETAKELKEIFFSEIFPRYKEQIEKKLNEIEGE